MVEWRDIDGFPRYQVSDDGQVQSLIGRPKLLRPFVKKDGYVGVRLSENGRVHNKLLHQLVGKAFLPTDPDRLFINHKNGNKKDNTIGNLEWCTHSENHLHAFRVLGRKPSISNRKLTDTQIIAIRYDPRCQVSIAAEFGVYSSVVSRIKSGKTWTSVTHV